MMQKIVDRITRRVKYILECDSSLWNHVLKLRDVCKDPGRHDGLSESLKSLLIIIENELLHQGELFKSYKKAFWEPLDTNAPMGSVSITVDKLMGYSKLIQDSFKNDESITKRLNNIKADEDVARAAVDRLTDEHNAQIRAAKELICAINMMSQHLITVDIEEIMFSETVGTKIIRFGKYDEGEIKPRNAKFEMGWFSVGGSLLIMGYKVLCFAGSKLLAPVIALYKFIAYCFKATYETVFKAVIFVKSLFWAGQPNVQVNRQDPSSSEPSFALNEPSIGASPANNTADETRNEMPNDTNDQAMTP